MFNSAWFENLNAPFLSPTDWIFMPVWIILYILIFISLIFYIFTKQANKQSGYVYFTIQMILNLLWTPAFFIMRNILLAFIIIILLDIFVYLNFKKFYNVSRISALLLIPYIMWILFATYLNGGYLVLNQ